MNRPYERRRDANHPHTQMVRRREFRRFVRGRTARIAAFGAPPAPPMTREQYEAIQATLPEADRIPW